MRRAGNTSGVLHAVALMGHCVWNYHRFNESQTLDHLVLRLLLQSAFTSIEFVNAEVEAELGLGDLALQHLPNLVRFVDH